MSTVTTLITLIQGSLHYRTKGDTRFYQAPVRRSVQRFLSGRIKEGLIYKATVKWSGEWVAYVGDLETFARVRTEAPVSSACMPSAMQRTEEARVAQVMQMEKQRGELIDKLEVVMQKDSPSQKQINYLTDKIEKLEKLIFYTMHKGD